MKLLLHISPLSKYTRNTDSRYLSKFQSHSSYFKDIQFYNDSNWLNGTYDFANNLGRKITSKISLPVNFSFRLYKLFNCGYLPSSYILNDHYDGILAHGAFPICLAEKLPPIIWETGMSDLNYYQRLFNSSSKGKQAWELKVKLNQAIGTKATLIGVSHPSAAQRFKQIIPELANKVRVLPPFLPHIEFISWDSYIEKFLDFEIINITFIGNQSRRKGLEMIYQALNQMPSSILKHLRLTIVSAYSDGLVVPPSHIKVIHLTDISHKKVNELLRKTHIYCMPSRAEAYGFTYIEAMASGCVVIAPAQDPQDYLLDYGKAGILIDSEDSLVLANALTKAIKNIDYSLMLAGNALKRAEISLGPRPSAHAYCSAFQEISSMERNIKC